MMISTGRHKGRLRPVPLLKLEAQYTAIEGQRAVKI
jgi:hypothetical protein